MIDLMLGDCRERMATLEPDSVDSIVTDPPYGLSFMGKGWDHGVPGVEFWTEALRVAKPGAHLLAFGGTRTFHRLACAIEDAGWKIRDCVMWVYGCLDDQTRVATSEGVKPYHKTKVGDTVLCYDPDNGEYTYQPILEIVEYEYSDTAYRLIGDFGEQVVSRNHRVIVERGGKEVFDLAENVARQQQARIPILENLPELRKTLSDAEQIAGHAEQDVQRGLRKDAYQQSEIGSSSDANESAEGQDGQLCGLRGAGLEAGRLVAEDKQADMQQGVQRQAARVGVANPRSQGARELEARIGGGVQRQDDGRNQPGMEGRADVPQQEGRVCESVNQVRAMPAALAQHGTQGRVRNGASTGGCTGNGQTADALGVRSSHQPRCDGQPATKLNAVQDQRRAQGVRAWRGHKTVVVRVVPFHYTGKVWCLRVPTGAFVAVRNGVAFPTGNSGFPKSLDVSKAIDKAGGASPREQSQILRSRREAVGMTRETVAAALNCTVSSVRDWEEGRSRATGAAVEFIVPSQKYRTKLADLLGYSSDERCLIGVTDDRRGDGTVYGVGHSGVLRSGGNTDAARQWSGWGTALKPAWEPIIVARKPLEGTVAENVLAHGTGALNIDGCRVPGEPWKAHSATGLGSVKFFTEGETPVIDKVPHDAGRWPANVIYDGSEEVVALFPVAKGQQGAVTGSEPSSKTQDIYGSFAGRQAAQPRGDNGSAARFFYCAKASRKDRNEGCEALIEKALNWSSGTKNPGSFQSEGTKKAAKNHHPTVKPTELMRYLCRLVTPPGGVVLDPFMGSGSTGKAATIEGFDFIGIELEPEYFKIAQARIGFVEAICK